MESMLEPMLPEYLRVVMNICDDLLLLQVQVTHSFHFAQHAQEAKQYCLQTQHFPLRFGGLNNRVGQFRSPHCQTYIIFISLCFRCGLGIC